MGSLSSTLQNRGTLRLQDIELALKAANISKEVHLEMHFTAHPVPLPG